jgi:branched-chain amino acid aminotransferase
MKKASINGKIIPASEVAIPISNIEILYGFGVYETMKLRKGNLFFVNEHIDRLFNSAWVLGLGHEFTKKQLRKWIEELIAENNAESTNIKIILLGGDEQKLYMFLTNPLYIEKRDYRDGVRVITFPYERFLPQAKSLNMLGSYVAYTKAKGEWCYEALLVNRDVNITEGTRSNFFAIRDKTLYSPPSGEILDGITRKTVIECVRENGYEVVEEDIALSDIFDFDGAFLTNTSGKVVPIREIDGKSFGEIAPNIAGVVKFYDEYLKKLSQKI